MTNRVLSLVSVLCEDDENVKEMSFDQRLEKTARRLPLTVEATIRKILHCDKNDRQYFTVSLDSFDKRGYDKGAYLTFLQTINRFYTETAVGPPPARELCVGGNCAFRQSGGNWRRGMVCALRGDRCDIVDVDAGLLLRGHPVAEINKLYPQFVDELPFVLRCVLPSDDTLAMLHAPDLKSFQPKDTVKLTLLSLFEPCLAVVESKFHDEKSASGFSLQINMARIGGFGNAQQWKRVLEQDASTSKGISTGRYPASKEPCNVPTLMLVTHTVNSTEIYLRDIVQSMRVRAINEVLKRSYANVDRLKFERLTSFASDLPCAIYDSSLKIWLRGMVTEVNRDRRKMGVTIDAVAVDEGFKYRSLPVEQNGPCPAVVMLRSALFPISPQVYRVSVVKSTDFDHRIDNYQEKSERLLKELLRRGSVARVTGIAPRNHSDVLLSSAPVKIELKTSVSARFESVWTLVERLLCQRENVELMEDRKRLRRGRSVKFAQTKPQMVSPQDVTLYRSSSFSQLATSAGGRSRHSQRSFRRHSSVQQPSFGNKNDEECDILPNATSSPFGAGDKDGGAFLCSWSASAITTQRQPLPVARKTFASRSIFKSDMSPSTTASASAKEEKTDTVCSPLDLDLGTRPTQQVQQQVVPNVEKKYLDSGGDLNVTTENELDAPPSPFLNTVELTRDVHGGTPRNYASLREKQLDKDTSLKSADNEWKSEASFEQLNWQKVIILEIRSASEIFLHTAETKAQATTIQKSLQKVLSAENREQCLQVDSVYAVRLKGSFWRAKLLRYVNGDTVELELVDSGETRQIASSAPLLSISDPFLRNARPSCIGPCRLAGHFNGDKWLSLRATTQLRCIISEAGPIDAALTTVNGRCIVHLRDLANQSINQQFQDALIHL